MQHHKTRLWKLLALKLSADASQQELSELNDIQLSSEEKQIVNSIELFWNQKNDSLNINDETEEERFHLILNAESEESLIKADKNPRSVITRLNFKKYKWIFAAAASVMVFFAIRLFFKEGSALELLPPLRTGVQEVFVKPGSKSKIILPDGTVVRLNSSSKLRYNNDFNKNIREVSLEGEAYFDVTKNPKHPFIVHTSNIDITVLGTVFNVKSYEQDQTIETTLLRGSIEVYNKNNASAPIVILKPNEKLIFRKEVSEKIKPKNSVTASVANTIVAENISISTLPANKPDSLKNETSWLYNKLIIDNDDFTKMAEKMERWYGVKIEVLSPELEQYHFKGIFENETIEQALNALQLTAKFRYKINNDNIKIMK